MRGMDRNRPAWKRRRQFRSAFFGLQVSEKSRAACCNASSGSNSSTSGRVVGRFLGSVDLAKTCFGCLRTKTDSIAQSWQ